MAYEANMPTLPVAPIIVTFDMMIEHGDVLSVDCTLLRLPKPPSSTPLPHGRRMSTVSLLPSGTEPVPATTGRYSLRNIDTWPSTSWDEVAESAPTGHRSP